MASEVYPHSRTSSSRQTSVPLVPRPVVRLNGTTMVMARFLAIKAVKRQLQAAGYRTSHVEMRVIAAQANAFVAQHREELLLEATEFIARVPGLQKMSDAEERRRSPQLRTIGQARKPWPAGVSDVHNSRPER
jgi:hypothetical protein